MQHFIPVRCRRPIQPDLTPPPQSLTRALTRLKLTRLMLSLLTRPALRRRNQISFSFRRPLTVQGRPVRARSGGRSASVVRRRPAQ